MRTYEESIKYWEPYVHTKSQCDGKPCPFHNPSVHSMNKFPLNLRTDPWASPLIERICPHGIGHPDPDSIRWMDEQGGKTNKGWWGIHGCCGCCQGQGAISVTTK